MGGKLNFVEDFFLSGIAAGVSKTAAAPIERVKLLVQNQDEMIKQGRLSEPYKELDCYNFPLFKQWEILLNNTLNNPRLDEP